MSDFGLWCNRHDVAIVTLPSIIAAGIIVVTCILYWVFG